MFCASKDSLLFAFVYIIFSKFAGCRVSMDSVFNIASACLYEVYQPSRSNAGLWLPYNPISSRSVDWVAYTPKQPSKQLFCASA
jgi:hypothetical protein